MELVEGQSLGQVIATAGLPPEQVLQIGIALSDALTAAHAKGVVHRDLKPANVMRTPEGRIKVLDFGLAKLVVGGSETDAQSAMTDVLTDAGMVLRTVAYMAPEQVRGEEVDARSDLFALGIILYEMATGRRPFGGATPGMIASAQRVGFQQDSRPTPG